MAYVSAVIYCDAAVPARGCWTVVNAFDILEFPEFPAAHPGWEVLVGVSDVFNTAGIDLEVEVMDPEAEVQGLPRAVIYYDVDTLVPNRLLNRVWKRFHTGEVEIARAGKLDVRLLLDGNLEQVGTIHVKEA